VEPAQRAEPDPHHPLRRAQRTSNARIGSERAPLEATPAAACAAPQPRAPARASRASWRAKAARKRGLWTA
jgi:hypothetical protein